MPHTSASTNCSFRIDVQASYKNLYSDVGYWFQNDGKRSIDRGFVGGAENGTGFTNTSSIGSNQWYYRTNVNIGYYF